MNGCHEYDALIERMLADEIEHAERNRLLEHAESCAGCRQFVELHHRLLEPVLETGLPTDEEFAALRGAVLRQLDRPGARVGRPASGRLGELFRGLLAHPIQAAGLAAVALVLFTAGALFGWQQGAAPIVMASPNELDWLSREAASNRSLADAEDSRYLYSNVGFRELPDGRMGLSFDVTRHVEVARPRDDALVREVLVQSLLQPSSVGTRLDAVSYAGGLIDPKVKQALIVTMLDDASQAVRLRALEILADHVEDEEVQTALLAVLRAEESVQMRMLAMDQLAASSVPPERLGAAIDDLRPEPALLIRAADHRIDAAHRGRGAN